MSERSIPVTILSGCLGAGKTTVLANLLRTAGDRDIAVLVNDVGELNIDAELLDGTDLRTAEGGVAELSNGCICCELQDDLRTEVVRLARTREFDHLVVEASGISEPAPIAHLFTTDSSAAARYDVDTTVTVVNAQQFRDAFAGDSIERTETEDGETRPLSDLIVEQVEFCDVLLLNKCDLVADDDLDRIEETLRAIQPGAELIRTVHGDIDPAEVLETGRFDPAEAGETAGWKRALAEGDYDGHDHDGSQRGEHDHDHRHPDEVYGVTSFTHRRRRPFHPERFAELLGSLPDALVRSKGFAWVAGRETRQELGQAGPSVRVTPSGPWIASLPEIEQDLYRRNRSNLEWDDEWGDRLTRLVFIGTGVDEDALVAALDGCLLTDEEMDADWDTFENPFPTREGDTFEA